MNPIDLSGTTREQRNTKRLKIHTRKRVKQLIDKERKKRGKKMAKNKIELEREVSVFNNTVFGAIFHNIIPGLQNLHRMTDPTRYDHGEYKTSKRGNGIDYWIKKRDEATTKTTKSFYHRKIEQMFSSVESLLINMKQKDEEYFEITREQILEILNFLKEKYNIPSYRKENFKRTR